MQYRPFIIIPKLIEQPTWGGTYILNKKNFAQNQRFLSFKIGQSYEIFSGTKLATSIIDTSDKRFIPEIGYADTPDTRTDLFDLKPDADYTSLSDFIASDPNGALGPKIMKKYGKMPLLIKINQAQGNSFQLHIPHGQTYKHWIPKAESWYFLEDGLITFGVNPNKDINEYQMTCKKIEQFMLDISSQIKSNKKTLNDAQLEAQAYIRDLNPWQYVNMHKMLKGDVADLSGGGLHHSWEEHSEKNSFGNVVYEVQEDVMDPVSTIRSFDQGKIKNDGSVRSINVDDYFKLIDKDPAHNDLKTATQQLSGSSKIKSNMYCMDAYQLTGPQTFDVHDCFAHVHVEKGSATVRTPAGHVTLGAGHSCFIPYQAGSYTIDPTEPTNVLLSYLTS